MRGAEREAAGGAVRGAEGGAAEGAVGEAVGAVGRASEESS